MRSRNTIFPEDIGALGNGSLSRARIALIGLDSIGTRLAFELGRRGVGGLLLVDPLAAPSLYRGRQDDGSPAWVGDVSRERALADKLLKSGFQGDIQLSELDSLTEEALRNATAGASVLVHAFDHALPISSYWANTIALEQRMPILFVRSNSDGIRVGPFVHPISGACWVCARAREFACSDDAAHAIEVEEARTANRTATGHSTECHPFHERRAVDLICSDLVSWSIGRHGAIRTLSTILLIGGSPRDDDPGPVLPRPDCPACKARLLSCPRPGGANQIPLDAREAFEALIHPRTGLVRSLALLENTDPAEPAEPVVAHCLLSNYAFLSSGGSNQCFGKAFDRAEATTLALAEAVERYAGHCWDRSALVRSTCEDLKRAFVHPRSLILFDEEQYEHLPYTPFSERLQLEWVDAISLASDRSILVPSWAVYLDRSDPSLPGYLAPATTNGLAAGRTHQEAIRNALLEVLERDAFMITWMAQLPCMSYPAAAHPDPRVASVVKAYAAKGVDLDLFRCPVDHSACVFAAIARERNQRPGFPSIVIGLGADLFPSAAARRAVLEAIQVRKVLAHRLRNPRVRARMNEIARSPALVVEPEDHALFYAGGSNQEAFAFLYRGHTAQAWPPESDDLDGLFRRLLEHMSDAGLEIFIRDLTPPDIRIYQVNIARVIVPGFQPVDFGSMQRRLGGRRLFDLPQRLGLAPQPLTIEELNPYPHPFS